MTNIPQKSAGQFSLPVLGLGTWEMGGRYEKNTANDSREITAIQKAIELGLTHIDTAEVYADGHAEELVHEAIKDYDRDAIFITSKVSWEHLKYDEVITAAQGSLKRLGIDQIDLYLVHGPNPQTDLRETMRAMDELVDRGLIKYIGVSNFDKVLIVEAQSYSKHKIVANQINFSLSGRAYLESGTIDYCNQNEILTVAYRPLGFDHKYGLPVEGIPLLQQMATKYNKTPVQVALNWTINHEGVVALVKSSNTEHLEEDIAAVGWKMDDEDYQRLTEEFPQRETMNFGSQPVVRK